jgi:hypothetical protein
MKRLLILAPLAVAGGLALPLFAGAQMRVLPNPSYEEGAAAANEYSRQQQYQRYQLELLRRQYEYERLLQAEQAARMHPPSSDRVFNSAVADCASRARVRAYTYDLPDGRSTVEWFGTDITGRLFNECLSARGY